MDDKAQSGLLLLPIGLLIAIAIVMYLFIFVPWTVSNEVQKHFVVVEPYDEVKSIYCFHDYGDWWTGLISVFDYENGSSAYSSFKFNTATKKLEGKFNGIMLS